METLNLHINYDCPLACRYCCQRTDPNLVGQYLTADEMIEKVQEFMDYTKTTKCIVNISGGEPLLKFDDIHTLMKTFPNNSYEVSTSGYLLDEEKARILSEFGVTYILSVDGTERVTDYLRPLANGERGYFKGFKKNIPHILYYSPDTRAKLIVPKVLISEVFTTYLELEQLGFREIFITPNVYENEVDSSYEELKTGDWTDQDWQDFRNQIFMIVKEIQIGIHLNVSRCHISNVKFPMAKMMFPSQNPSVINRKRMICTVLDYKGGASAGGGSHGLGLTEVSACIHGVDDNITTQTQLLEKAENDFRNFPTKCPHDPDCTYLSSCIYSTCLTENLKAKSSNIWLATPFQCRTQRIYHDAALALLNTCQYYKNEVIDDIYHTLLRVKEVSDASTCSI